LEHSSRDPKCRRCPHEEECVQFMGVREDKIPLSEVRFDVIPPASRKELDRETLEDPEIPQLRRLYTICFATVYGQKLAEHVMPKGDPDLCGELHPEIIKGAHEADCSVRLFLLANMVAHQAAQNIMIEAPESNKAKVNVFRAKQLGSPRAVSNAKEYAAMCYKDYGSFHVSSLEKLTKDEMVLNFDDNLLASEITVGKFLVNHKIHRGGPPWEDLYAEKELDLDPYWLAIEPNYQATVLEPYVKDKLGNSAVKEHRWKVIQVIRYLKRNSRIQLAVFEKRQEILREALLAVVSSFGYWPDDFLWENKPVTDSLELYVYIGRAIQHHQCLLYLRGEPSVFDRKIDNPIGFGS
jgi:hypothetical protein